MIPPPERFRPLLLKTKLSVPQLRASLVSRPRLLSSLDEGAGVALTLICAPAGYGKTTLLAEWIASLIKRRDAGSPRVCWLSLDEGDNDPARFLSYLLAAFESVDASLENLAGAMLRSFPPPPLQAVLSGLINALYDLAIPVSLVLDDYQFLTNPAIHAGLAFFLERLPGTTHLVIATRSDPPMPLARLRARNQLVEVRAEQLRFNVDEAAAFLNQTTNFHLSPGSLAALENRTEGWIAGLQMASIAMQSHLSAREQEDIPQFIQAFSGSQRYILDYLAEEVFDHQPEDIRQFLLTTSILDRLCADLCDALLESKFASSQSTLDYLDQANLFLVALDDERGWYRYHHLFADLLRARLYQSQPDLVPKLHLRASAWYEQNGFLNEAVQHAFSAQDNERAADLIERYGAARWLESDFSIAQMTGRLPAEMLLARPRLGIYHAWLMIGQGHIQRAIPILNDLEKRLAARGAESGLGWIQSVIRLVRAYIAPPPDDLDCEPLPDFQALEEIPEEDLILRVAADLLYAMLLGRREELDLAAEVLVRCVQREQESTGTLAIPTAIPFLVRIRLMQGQLHEAETLCRELLNPVKESGARLLYTAGGMKIALAEVFYEWNHLDEAEEQIREGIRDNEPWDSISNVTGYVMLARILQAKGDQDGAAEVVQKLESRLAGHSLPQELQDELDTLKIRLLLANGNLQSAAEWADHVNLAEPPDFRQEHHRLALGYILLAQGRYTEAEHLLEKMANMALAGKRRARQIKFGLLLALARSGQGRIPEAIQLLDTCLSLAEPEGYVRVFLDTGEPARALLARYLELPALTHSAYAQGMLSEFAGTPEPFVASLLELLTRREFEVLRLLAQGCSNRQIAEKLFLAEGTVKYYVHAILQKLQVHSRTQAVIVAKERRLI